MLSLPHPAPEVVLQCTWNVVFELLHGETQCGLDERAVSVDRAVPLELGHGRQAELVRQVTPSVPLLLVLRLTQRQRVRRVLVHVVPVVVLVT